MTTQQRNKAQAWTLIDVLIIVAVLLVLGIWLVPHYMRGRFRAQRIACTGNLKVVCLAAKTWAIDHTDRYPIEVSMADGGAMEAVSTGSMALVYQVMSNELNTPLVLRCPADSEATPIRDFRGFDATNLSYFVGLEASATNAQPLLAGDRNIANKTGLRSGTLFASTNDPVWWTKSIHNRNGNIGLSDGSVQQLTTVRLREAIANTGFPTNRLLMP